MIKLSLYLFLSAMSVVSYAAEESQEWFWGTDSAQYMDILLLADYENNDVNSERSRSGIRVLPAAVNEEKKEKKCMTVCQRWGEDCMMDSKRGVRKCRRTCKEFGQECF